MIQRIFNALSVLLLLTLVAINLTSVQAQALGPGTIEGTVVDPNNAAVPTANVTISNPITGYTRSTVSNHDVTFRFDNVPPNNYQLIIASSLFNTATQNLSLRTSVPISLKVPLAVGSASESVTVNTSTSEVLENVSSTHTA